jgi:hypothetical protein
VIETNRQISCGRLLRGGDLQGLGAAPQAFEAVILASFRGEDVNQHVAVVGQDPLGLVVAFDACRQFASLLFELDRYFVTDGLDLSLIGARADDKEIGKRSNTSEVENLEVGRLFRFGGADGNEPGGRLRLFGFFLSQNTLLFVSYYIAAVVPWASFPI